MNVLSLFSGIGGLELGLERAGMTTVGQVEKDPYCLKVLAKHWPEVPKHDEVRTAAEWWLSAPRPRVDIVCGGFPCQPVSLAGKGLAQEDERWLWPAMCDVIRALRPRYALMENVPGLAQRGLNDVLGSLADLGFDAIWNVLPAAAVGAPHLRRRLVILAADTERVDLRVEPWRSGGESRSSSTLAGFDGTAWSLADAAGIGEREPTAPAESVATSGNAWQESCRRSQSRGAGETLSDSDHAGCGEQRWTEPSEPQHSTAELGGWWAIEPDVGRVAHGIPSRVDRLRALGNAVVPQVAEYVGRMILNGM